MPTTRSFSSAATAPTTAYSSDFSCSSQQYSCSDVTDTSYIYSNDDGDDEGEDEDAPTFNKSLLGSPFKGAEDLVSHPCPGNYIFEYRNPNLDGPLSVVSDYDYQGEVTDFRFTRALLVASGVETFAISLSDDQMTARLPDGSRAIMKEFQNALWNRHTGHPAFDGDGISNELKLRFIADACAIRAHRPHLSKNEELRLNRDSHERLREWAPIWSESFDQAPVSIEDADMVTKLHRCGKKRVLISKKARVRNDMPQDPYLFSSCELGREAARALEEYQADKEQLERSKPVSEFERPHFEDCLALELLQKGPYECLNDNPGENDAKIARVIASLKALCAHPEEYDEMLANNPHACDRGSGIFYDRVGLEHQVIVDIWNDLQRQGRWTARTLDDAGFLSPEDDFGDNPEYLSAKLLWWRQKMGIRSLEAIVRFHFEHIRALRRPPWGNFFLSIQAEYELNQMSTDWSWTLLIPSPTVTKVQVFDKLHAQPVNRKTALGSRVEDWILHQIEDGFKLLPDNLFDNSSSGRAACNALVEYQESREPGTEAHHKIEGWARPRQMYQDIEAREDVYSTQPRLICSKGLFKDQKSTQDIAAPFDPETIVRDLMALLRPRNHAENQLLSLIQPDVLCIQPETPRFHSRGYLLRPNKEEEKRPMGISKSGGGDFTMMNRHRSEWEDGLLGLIQEHPMQVAV